MSRAALPKNSTALKEFMNGRTQNISLVTFLAVSRALDIPYMALVDSCPSQGTLADRAAALTASPDFDPHDEKYIVNEALLEEQQLRITAAANLKFLRSAVGASLKDFAAAAKCFKDEKPDVSLLRKFESGEKLIPPMTALRLSEEYGFSVDSVYE